jgi:hypothetical protein
MRLHLVEADALPLVLHLYSRHGVRDHWSLLTVSEDLTASAGGSE